MCCNYVAMHYVLPLCCYEEFNVSYGVLKAVDYSSYWRNIFRWYKKDGDKKIFCLNDITKLLDSEVYLNLLQRIHNLTQTYSKIPSTHKIMILNLATLFQFVAAPYFIN